ncbi:hypothetical protein BAUCODRAFT_35346 [Baudoinia panamericana UAMH 10762]|uniref:Uncharacterized protein n=1 Tax=Baudoinia panamericana (strain UAMH 10762) TaxID=717646 RepID=M2N966_BAUPA|nr:uncharacterized protein BAUCODRAFT_35346 [Baudoinia panamericana UAMH 10762]EMC95365.1 hypothetical protein BAUCODRAFT_35346 [Baudoinia panamericana UAMH 10762]
MNSAAAKYCMTQTPPTTTGACLNIRHTSKRPARTAASGHLRRLSSATFMKDFM